ncbi:MAG: flagellar biosynthesis regulator FlaF [Pseudomonadota bacterium]
MNALAQARRAYGSTNAPVRTARGIEYQALARVTQRLSKAARNDRKDFPELAAALLQNKKLWSVFAVDVANPENGLPEQLRANIVGLMSFTHRHTSAVLAREATVQPLIEINTAIMRGLASGGR